MRKIILIVTLLLLTGCTKVDPTCLNGYFVIDLNGEFKGFCTTVFRGFNNFHSDECYDTPGLTRGRGVKSQLLIKEGIVVETKCYNVWSENK